ncbi:hypothetical protein L3073_06040 [Ancylomarina sp. DW003]|nr:hypothetical protein [Ancylomarina sp. DW003]MDE5421761.1 hypothetical protein [Ancylomarina sp. DW003]
MRTHDGKEPIVDSLPIAYYQLGNGREELVINRMLTGCALRIIIANEDGAEVEGTLVLTAEK